MTPTHSHRSLMARRSLTLTLSLAFLLPACGDKPDDTQAPDGDTDSDTDADSDSDTDADSDTDLGCRIEVEPGIGSYTPDYEPDTDCSCSASDPSCHAIYIGSAASIAGNLVDLAVEKAAGGPPSVDVSYWIAVGADTQPNCTDLAAFVTRATGTWPHTEATLQVADVPIWPDEASFDAAPAGEQKKLFAITGGLDGPGDRTWFQQTALVFTKVCD